MFVYMYIYAEHTDSISGGGEEEGARGRATTDVLGLGLEQGLPKVKSIKPMLSPTFRKGQNCNARSINHSTRNSIRQYIIKYPGTIIAFFNLETKRIQYNSSF